MTSHLSNPCWDVELKRGICTGRENDGEGSVQVAKYKSCFYFRHNRAEPKLKDPEWPARVHDAYLPQCTIKIPLGDI